MLAAAVAILAMLFVFVTVGSAALQVDCIERAAVAILAMLLVFMTVGSAALLDNYALSAGFSDMCACYSHN